MKGVRYYVESDGDRVPKDVYICNTDGERVVTMEGSTEDNRFRLARHIVALLNGSNAGFESAASKSLGEHSN